MHVVLAVIAILTVVIITQGVVLVQQAEAMVIERLGKFNRVIHSGLHIIIPFAEKVRTLQWRFIHKDVGGELKVSAQHLRRIDLREKVLDFPKQHIITKDNISLGIDALIYFQVTDPKRTVYEVENLPRAIEKLTQTTLRNVAGGMELDECLVSRNEINAQLREVLVEATNKWGVRVSRVEIQDIMPAEALRNAMEKQMRAERDRRAQILMAEGQKQAAVLEAEGKKEAAVTAAEGQKQAKILTAEGQAIARLKIAEAEAQAIAMIRKSLKNEGEASSYLIALKYLESLEEIASGNETKTVFMPYEASAALGSLGSIRELFTKMPVVDPSSFSQNEPDNNSVNLQIKNDEEKNIEEKEMDKSSPTLTEEDKGEKS